MRIAAVLMRLATDTSGIDPDGTFYFYKVTAINSQGAGVASALLTARWTHHPRPSVTVHTRAARPGTATAAITNGATDSTWVVTWVDGPAATCRYRTAVPYGLQPDLRVQDKRGGRRVHVRVPPTHRHGGLTGHRHQQSVENPDHGRPVPSNRHGDFKLRLGSVDGG